MMVLRDYLEQARKTQTAIAHFNISNWEGLRAVKELCQEIGQPIILGVSEGEAEFLGLAEIAALVRHLRQRLNLPLFLNADHFKDLHKVRRAAELGFDSILFDAVEFDLAENIRKTKVAVELVKSINPEVLVEGELGYIGFGSVVREELPAGAVVTEAEMIKPAEAKEFVEQTGVELIGPGVGNIHGIVKGYQEKLSFERIGELSRAVTAYLVLHGASGIAGEELRKAVKAGMVVVHLNTELRLAWRTALEEELKTHPEEIAPYKLLLPTVEAMKKVMKEKLLWFH